MRGGFEAHDRKALVKCGSSWVGQQISSIDRTMHIRAIKLTDKRNPPISKP